MSKHRIDVHIPPKLLPLIQKPKRIKIVVGGRGGGKSIGVTDLLLKCADDGERICCTREFQNTIDDSVHYTIQNEIDRLGVQGFSVTDSRIRSRRGGEFFYKGLARNITSLQSLGSVDKLWIEEGQSVSEKSLKVLTPSIRSIGEKMPEIWITMNRSSRQDAVAKKYLERAESELARCGYYEDDLCMIIEINYRDNPWFPDELELERQDDKENLDPDEYDHIWDGAYDESVERAIIKKAWFDAAIDAHKVLGIEPRGATICAFDPADEGPDSKAFTHKRGVVVLDATEFDSKDGNEACDEATERAIRANADQFVWDCDGMGALLRRQIGDSFKGIKCNLVGYKGSGEVSNPKSPYDGLKSLGPMDKPKSNKETFANRRAQNYMKLANRFYLTYQWVVEGKYQDPDSIISISSDIKYLNKLRTECCRIPSIPNGAGKIQLMSKENLKKKYELDSPGMADCLAMSEEELQTVHEPVKLNFKGWG